MSFRNLFFILLFLPSFCLASVIINFEPPKERTNGESLNPVKELEKYTLYCRKSRRAPYEKVKEFKANTENNGSYETTFGSLFETTGVYYCALTATDLQGRESDKSGQAKIVYQMRPNKPSNVTISIVIEN